MSDHSETDLPRNGKVFDPMAVTWTENYNDFIAKVWKKIPDVVGKFITIVAIFMMGISINGDWVSLYVHICKQFGFKYRDVAPQKTTWPEISVESLRMQNFLGFFVGSLIVSYGMYFLLGGFLHWYFYVHQRDRPEEWKCQPKKWLSADLERHEILLGSFTLMLNALTSAIISCYISNGGYSCIYYDPLERGGLWIALQIPVLFIYQDYTTYWIHRIFHTPFLYKHFHKLHHKYKQPTAFSVTAIHPVESLFIELTLIAPIFLVPMHWAAFYTVALYTYYHGIIDHSGVNFKAYWWQPWQPPAIFHDNHHQYFHVNFGFNMFIWDRLHGTERKKDRVYTEEIFYGKGKSVTEVSEELLKADLEERDSENPLAYQNNTLIYKLTEDEVLAIQNKKIK